MQKPKPVEIPDPPRLELETVNRPRDAFFSRFEDVKAKDAAGRIAVEQITPYPPGVPAVLPGERTSPNKSWHSLFEPGLKERAPCDGVPTPVPSVRSVRLA